MRFTSFGRLKNCKECIFQDKQNHNVFPLQFTLSKVGKNQLFSIFDELTQIKKNMCNGYLDDLQIL